eukprot:1768433-Alexandrium_andersonii.AAC.1
MQSPLAHRLAVASPANQFELAEPALVSKAGHASHIDPVMAEPLHHVVKGLVLWPQLPQASVFLGCLSCQGLVAEQA